MVTKTQRAKEMARDLARFMRILQRQKDYHWGADYQPGTRAVRGEAPSTSVSGTLPSKKLKREVHALSRPELFCFALALYHPGLWEFHEQHALYPSPKQHPLARNPAYSMHIWPQTTGTFAIAKRLHLVDHHPMVWMPTSPLDPHRSDPMDLIEQSGSGKWLPSAYQGDGLLFMQDDLGPYLLSWDVKSMVGEHGRPGGEAIEQMRPGAEKTAAVRDAIYVEYMHELGIRIVRISRDLIPPAVQENLFHICKKHARPINLPMGMQEELRGEFQLALKTGEVPRAVINRIVRTDDQFLTAYALMCQEIWNRELRVNFFYPIVVDAPLLPEEDDVLVTFGHLFKR